ncbi:type VI secretion system-associated FHA domain protein TagH [Vibrio sp. S9_S30]|uniref:type VI secretion system-associated FHA domain protein TagH n=1 Tax=Vibrio sp. S9_S30 TaxID=2720226 RepID=UPI001680B511|nr:type VI secretion system-associated FHA domain protein TagH [Vibrio sp. S9_S30]MBD1556921.1 type VI secretion system-associated FHA domain protein TagH [Vibrio sp. S9_S30]
MGIVLSINSFHKFTSEIQSEFEFSDNNVKDSIKLGRAESCDWTLPDPERVVSSVHAEIIKFGEDYLIRDLSTNGLFINRSVTPVGSGNEIKLNDNDIITFGEYEILVGFKSNDQNTFHFHNDTNRYDIFGQSDINNFEQSKPFESEAIDNKFEDDFVNSLSNEPVFESDIGLTDDFFNLSETHVTNELVGDTSVAENVQRAVQARTSLQDSSISSKAVAREESVLQAQSEQQPASPAQREEMAHPESSRAAPRPNHQFQRAAESTPQLNTRSKSNEMDAFLSGLGISRNMVPTQHSDEWFKQLGESFSLLLGGLMDTLHHRAEFKQTNRLNHTAFQRHENNPLKFSANLEDAIHNLYNRNSSSFLGPQNAIQEAFDDIEKHEKALMQGVDGAVKGVMGLLNPDYISSKNVGEGVLEKIIPGKTQANFWKNYEKQYLDLTNELEGNSIPFYLEDFAKSYEMALKKG